MLSIRRKLFLINFDHLDIKEKEFTITEHNFWLTWFRRCFCFYSMNLWFWNVEKILKLWEWCEIEWNFLWIYPIHHFSLYRRFVVSSMLPIRRNQYQYLFKRQRCKLRMFELNEYWVFILHTTAIKKYIDFPSIHIA